MIGTYNSSITRVQPFFRMLFMQDSSGQKWIPELLAECPINKSYAEVLSHFGRDILSESLIKRKYSDKVLKHHGIPAIILEKCFEYRLPPPREFLRWMINNFEQIGWPDHGCTNYSQKTLDYIYRLRGDMGPYTMEKTKAETISKLDEWGIESKKLKWWAFEGFTYIDCYIESSHFILAIEGKRTERVIKRSTWYDRRNQIIRNLETTQQDARRKKKEFALILITETPNDPVTLKIIEESLPHFTSEERSELLKHYLGSITWKQACDATGLEFSALPNTTEDAIKLLG